MIRLFYLKEIEKVRKGNKITVNKLKIILFIFE